MKEKYYITTPIYYPSANFHIGHCYTTIIADSIARYQRLKEKDVFFLTGTDEHGQKIENKAKEKGVTPKEYVDEIVDNAKDLWKSLGISYDKFIRTTDEYHEKAVQKIFDKLYEQNVLNSNNDSNSGSYDGIIEVNGTKIDTNAAINQAVNLKYGTQSNSSTSNDTQGSDKTITNYKPVDNLKDADGKPLCGAKDSGSIIEF